MDKILKTHIDNRDIPSIKELIAKREIFPKKKDFLSFSIKNKHNDIVKLLINFANINISANNNLAVEVAESCHNEYAKNLIKKVTKEPLFTITVTRPFTDVKAQYKVHKGMLFKGVKRQNPFVDLTRGDLFLGDKLIQGDDESFMTDIMYPHNKDQDEWPDNFDLTFKVKLGNAMYFPSNKSITFADLIDTELQLSSEEYKYIFAKKNNQIRVSSPEIDVLKSNKPVSFTLLACLDFKPCHLDEVFAKVKDVETLPNLSHAFHKLKPTDLDKLIRISTTFDFVKNLEYIFEYCSKNNIKTSAGHLGFAVDHFAYKCVESLLKRGCTEDELDEALKKANLLNDYLLISVLDNHISINISGNMELQDVIDTDNINASIANALLEEISDRLSKLSEEKRDEKAQLIIPKLTKIREEIK